MAGIAESLRLTQTSPWAQGERKGREVLVDALLLARCEVLICAQSNVAVFAAFANPHSELVYLGQRAVHAHVAATAAAAAAAMREGSAPPPRRQRIRFKVVGQDGEAESAAVAAAARRLGLGGWVRVEQHPVGVGASRDSQPPPCHLAPPRGLHRPTAWSEGWCSHVCCLASAIRARVHLARSMAGGGPHRRGPAAARQCGGRRGGRQRSRGAGGDARGAVHAERARGRG